MADFSKVNPVHAVDHMGQHIPHHLSIDLDNDQTNTGEEKRDDSRIGEDMHLLTSDRIDGSGSSVERK